MDALDFKFGSTLPGWVENLYCAKSPLAPLFKSGEFSSNSIPSLPHFDKGGLGGICLLLFPLTLTLQLPCVS